MIGAALQTKATPAHWPPAAPARWAFPLTIKCILLDLDGTIMPSYKTLAALQYIDEHLTAACRSGISLIDHCLAEAGFNGLLHRPPSARRAAIAYARKHNISISPAILRAMSGLQEQSFCLYRGFRDLLARARAKGVFVGIYTNTTCQWAVCRMLGSLLLPSAFHAIWARNEKEASVEAIRADVRLREYAEVLIPCSYSKPDDTPLRELAALTGARSSEILFIGDGLNDLEATYRDPTDPRAVFCFQERGAADICAKTSALNARLRPGQIALGADAVNNRIKHYNVERDIIRLRLGFVDLLSLIDHGRIRLAAPDRIPIARANALALGPGH